MFDSRNEHQDQIDFHRHPGCEGLEIMTARIVRRAFDRHAHDEYTIGINIDGHGEFWCRGSMHAALTGTLNLIEPGEIHTGRAAGSGGWTYRSLYMNPKLLESLSADMTPRKRVGAVFCHNILTHPKTTQQFERLAQALVSLAPGLIVDSLLHSAIHSLIGDHPHNLNPEVGSRSVRRAREYIEAFSSRDIRLQELAEVAGCNQFHLIRSFHRQVGVPPHKYLVIVRVNQAKHALANGKSIAEVATEVGFCDQSHFHRCFLRTAGTTPARYQRSILYKNAPG